MGGGASSGLQRGLLTRATGSMTGPVLLSLLAVLVSGAPARAQETPGEDKPAPKPTAGPEAPKPTGDPDPATEPAPAVPKAVAGLGEGLFAVLQTDLGTMVARLEFQRAPFTTGNFVGLATGRIGWLPPEVLRARLAEIRRRAEAGEDTTLAPPTEDQLSHEPFYDGLIFDRIVPGFAVQTGCPLGDGTGNPGYEFIGDTHPELRHDGPGVLSMAVRPGNGYAGSQFSFTLRTAAELDGTATRPPHPIFGKVVRGLEVLRQLGAIPPVGNPRTGRPSRKVTLRSVTIHAVGAAAEAFDPLDVTRKHLPEPSAALDPARVPDPKAAPTRNLVLQGIVVRHKDVEGLAPVIKVSREEAEKQALRLVRLARSKGADWLELEKRYSDLQSKGALMPLELRPQLSEDLKKVFRLRPGQVSEPVHEPRVGFMIFRAAPDQIAARHILVTWKGTAAAGERVTRTKQEARERIETALAQLKAGKPFDRVALEFHENRRNPSGDLGAFTRDRMVDAFSEAAFKLKVGELSGVVETELGFHIILRSF